ncbi:MAG: CDP-alcohol phosphatidyltransferase family protein, partial [bacterium]
CFIMKDKLVFIKLALIPLFILTLFYQKPPLSIITFLPMPNAWKAGLMGNQTPIFSVIIFLGFIALNVLSFFYSKGKTSKFIDPIANKLFLCLAFIFLFLKLGFPKWITYMVIMRECLVIIGWFVFYNIFPKEGFARENGMLGKGSLLFQIITILLYLLYGMSPLTYFFSIVMLTFTIASLVDYLTNV